MFVLLRVLALRYEMMCFTGVYDLVLLPLKLDMLGQCYKQSQLHFETRNIFNVTRNTFDIIH